MPNRAEFRLCVVTALEKTNPILGFISQWICKSLKAEAHRQNWLRLATSVRSVKQLRSVEWQATMARRRFFVAEIRRGTAELTGPDAEHLVRVLRAEVGQLYELSDNCALYLARIEVARKSVVSFRILEKLASPTATVHVSLLAALFKFDRFEWLVEKATELGVSVIQPFEATRTEPGLAQASQKRRTRWEKIAIEASQQSRRVHLPRIEPAVRFAEALQTGVSVRLLLDEIPNAPPILERLPEQRRSADRVALLLGPEGGWTEEERLQAVEAGWLPCSLGTTILRAETAGVAGLAILQAAWRCSGR